MSAVLLAVALQFGGLTLDAAQQTALARSPDVRAARAVVDENRSALAAARGALGPALTGSYVTAPQAGSNGSTISSKITSYGVQTTIGDLAAYSPLVAAAGATLSSAQLSETAAERAERLKVVNLYFDALKARAVNGARQSALAAAQEQRRAAEVRFAAGDVPKLDVVRADVAVARATSDAELARVADVNATEALRIETGAPADAFVHTVDAPPPAPARELTPEEAVTRAIALRPELRAAQRTADAARASARAAHAIAIPALTVGAGYASGVDSGQLVHAPTVNVSLNVPLGGAAGARARQADAVIAENVAKAASTQQAIEVEVAADARNVAATERASAAATAARVSAQTQLQATTLGYRSGASSSLELSTARDVQTQAVVDELSALYEEARARAILTLALGG